MAFTDTKLSYFHSFSKMPAQNSTTLGNAINKSGHTVTASEVWAQDIPYYGKMGSIEDVKSKVQPYARKNDMCYITAGADKGKTFQYDGNGNWTDITATLIDGALIKNANDDVVLLYHKGQTLTNLTAENNANTDSANNAARLWASRAKDGTSLPVGETRLIEQFVAPTDKALNGLASVAYAPVIANGSLVSGTGYYDYCFSGTILWATTRTAVTPIDCFEYVGDKVSDVADTVASHASTIATHTSEISELKEKLGIEDDDNPDSPSTPTLGGRVTALEDAVETLNGDATTEGSIAKSIKDAIDALGEVAVKSDITITDIKVKVGSGEATSLTPDANKSVTVEIPEVQAATTNVAGVVTISSDAAIESTASSTSAATVTAVAATRGAIEQSISSLTGRVAQLEGIAHFSVAVVDTLPTTLVENTIYLVPEDGKTSGNYVEYIAYKPEGSETVTTERIGTTAIDLEGYTTDEEHSALANRVTTVEGQVATLTGDETTDGSVAKALADAKSYAEEQASAAQTAAESTAADELAAAVEQIGKDIEAAKVTITNGTGIVVTPNDNETEFEISVSDSVATASDLTALTSRVTTLETTTVPGIDTRLQAAETTITSLTEEDGVIDGIESEIAALASETGRVTVVEGKVSDIETSLAEGGATANAIKTAQDAADDAMEEAQGKVASVTIGSTIPEGVSFGTDTKNPVLTIETAASRESVGNNTDAAKLVTGGVAQALATYYADLAEGAAVDTIDSRSLASSASSTQGSYVSVTTTGTVGTGLTVTVDDSALASTVSAAETAIQTVKVNGTEVTKTDTEVDITAIVGVDDTATNGIKVTKTSDNKVKVDVTPASYTSSTKTWTNDTNFATASDVATAISDAVNNITIPVVTTSDAAQAVGVTASGHEVSVATATYTPASGDTAASWTNKGYLVTGSTVETFVGAETAKALEEAKAYSDSLHSTSLDYVVLGDSESLPPASAETLGKIYLVAKANAPVDAGSALSGDYVEYMTRQVSETEYTWEKIGTTEADLTGYIKTIKNANGVSGVVTGNEVEITVQDGSTTQKGIVQLASTHESSDTTKAATGATVAAAIEALDATDVGEGAVKVSQTNGVVSSVTVETETLVSENAIKETTESETALITAADALAAIKLAKPENYVASVTGYTTTGAEVTTTQGAEIKVLDSRGTSVTANDLWGTTATMDANGVLTIAHDWINSAKLNWGKSITKVENNKAYTGEAGDTFYANIQTERIKNGMGIFKSSQLTSFNGDLSSLVRGDMMFYSAPLTSFNVDLSSLVQCSYMFSGTQLTSFNSDLSSLIISVSMFGGSQLTSFNGDLSSLVYATQMFNGCSNLTLFNGDLSSLVNGSDMFSNTNLDMESLETICDTLPNKSDLKTWNDTTKTYEVWDGNSDFVYSHTELDENCNKVQRTGTIGESDVATITITYSNVPNDENTINAITALFEETANTKGWTIITNAELGGTYTPSIAMADGTVQHYIYAIKHEADEKTANYVDGDGKYWTVDTAEAIIGPNVKYWSLFPTLEDAITEWGLTPYTQA